MSSDSNENADEKPCKLTYDKMIEDLSCIPINENDVLFRTFGNEDSQNDATSQSDLYERLEKFILFKSNLELENENLKSDFSLGNLNVEFESFEARLASLQHFIDISKKFFSINKK